ncbi:hypothetical protein LINGRAPRIM_LOCUS1946 [Linum grandiflorum]
MENSLLAVGYNCSVTLFILLSAVKLTMVFVFRGNSRPGTSSSTGDCKDDYNWRYDSDEHPDDVNRAAAEIENLQLDSKERNLTSYRRHAGDGG